MSEYIVNFFYTMKVEAKSKEEAEEKAMKFMETEEGQGIRISDMGIDSEIIPEYDYKI